MSESDSSSTDSVCLRLRSRKIARPESDPDKRCQIVKCWPGKRQKTKDTMAAKSGVTQKGEDTLYPTDELRRMDDAVTFRHGLDNPDKLRTSTPMDDAGAPTLLGKKTGP
jgi:hypothetical protein